MTTPSKSDIVTHADDSLAVAHTVNKRNKPLPLDIVEPSPTWPADYEGLRQRITTALSPNVIVLIQHIGSTSVPGLPAKAVIDLDLVVQDPTNEDSYAPALEAAGFQFLVREPSWFEHRVFGAEDPVANVHVWGSNTPEVIRHRVMRDWLIKNEEDRELYAEAKRAASKATKADGGHVGNYNDRKTKVLREILDRALADAGYIGQGQK
ncbi:hypothetical protein VHEMI08153 [[Torrubiella] hemipterigena]|uniref:GrpB domain protein n=1 Tax=[Torrubiella] hemipterigena TaxID=1531966 RepID=A0A0A1TP63_9HYPO|nr:hypothetical protein VHEMI08153 [[Torrubiella] hemipterigena]